MDDESTRVPRHTFLKLTLAVALVIAASTAVLFYAALEQVAPAEETNNATKKPSNSARSASVPGVSFDKVAEGFTKPIDIVFGDDQLFIVEQAGLVRRMDNGATVLDLTDRVDDSDNEKGLLGMVFDPDFASNNYVYVNYTRAGFAGAETVISRFSLNEGPGSETEILTVAQPFGNHNAGDLAFGPDGYLYIPLGDGGSSGDPQNNAQNLESLLGKILRIDVKSGDPYNIPLDNPFVGAAGRDEIWSLGWRNPWRISFDQQTGDLYVGDVGQGHKEEISVQEAGVGGGNFGWKCLEGTREFSACENQADFIPPLTEYDHASGECGASVTGGYVYRGQKTESLKDTYVFADFCRGQLYAYDLASPSVELNTVSSTEFMISTFGMDGKGEIYFADLPSGVIYQLIDATTE